jgi:hypothetical protein
MGKKLKDTAIVTKEIRKAFKDNHVRLRVYLIRYKREADMIGMCIHEDVEKGMMYDYFKDTSKEIAAEFQTKYPHIYITGA